MPLLGPRDALARRPTRVIVAGVSGSGKTTLATRIADVIEAPHIEIDGLFHGPNWTPRADFVADVERFVAGPTWTTEWQYSDVRQHLLHRCDLLVWLDLPTSTVMAQVTRRTVLRRLRRQELWNGNVEPPLRTIVTDREHIIRWAWSTRGKTHAKVSAARATRPELAIVRLRSHADSALWLREVLTPVSAADPRRTTTD